MLLRILPGQRDAALLWSDHFARTLKQQNFDRCIACPTLVRDDRNSILVVHVDDIQAAGKSSSLEPKLSKLGETYELKTEQELAVGESHRIIRFLKRKFSYHNHELHITSDPKYLGKLKEELKITSKASKPTPCTRVSGIRHHSALRPGTSSLAQEMCRNTLVYRTGPTRHAICSQRSSIQNVGTITFSLETSCASYTVHVKGRRLSSYKQEIT